MRAYIDESGDTGTDGKGSRWFVMGCAAIADCHVEQVRTSIREFCKLTNRQHPADLHFRKLEHDDKLGAISIITDSHWQGIVVAVDTTQLIPGAPLASPSNLYRYVARYMIELISVMAETMCEEANIYFERRKTPGDIQNIRQRVDRLTSRNDPRISSEWISSQRIYEMRKGLDECMCVADGLANAAFRALEPHIKWRTCETAYLKAFQSSLWTGYPREEDIHTRGFVIMPDPLHWNRFIPEYPWLEDLG